MAISGGSSGGGLFNAEGELVGITTFYLKDGQSLNFALPVEWIGEVARRKSPERGAIVDDKAPVAPAPGTSPKEGWRVRALAMKKAQDWQGLLAHCRGWTQAEPGNALAWSSLGVAYGNLGRHCEAVEAYREALRLKPDMPMPGTTSALLTDYWAVTGRPSKLFGSRCALNLMMPWPGINSPVPMPYQATAAPPWKCYGAMIRRERKNF